MKKGAFQSASGSTADLEILATDDAAPQSPALLSPLSPISSWPPEANLDPVKQPLDQMPSANLPTSKEVYGSLAVLLTYISGAGYLVWALAPLGWLDQWGWTWYPDRYVSLFPLSLAQQLTNVENGR